MKKKKHQEEDKIKDLQNNKRRRRTKPMKLIGRTRWRNEAQYEKKKDQGNKEKGRRM
jgi:hypothetical protein